MHLSVISHKGTLDLLLMKPTMSFQSFDVNNKINLEIVEEKKCHNYSLKIKVTSNKTLIYVSLKIAQTQNHWTLQTIR